MTIPCENSFCIYQEKGRCTLKSIELNNSGQCNCCIYADIDKKILKEAKIKLLKKYQEE